MTDPFTGLPRKRGRFPPKHGMHGTLTYHSWQSMVARCRRHPRYLRDGIKVCERWESFENFLADMGKRPEGKCLDRIDSAKDYAPDNCRWATMQEQQRNRRNNRIIDGLCLAEWVSRAVVSKKTVQRRLATGWPIQRAISEPDGRRKC